MLTEKLYKKNFNRATVAMLSGKLQAKAIELKGCRFYQLKQKKQLTAEIREIKLELTKELNRA